MASIAAITGSPSHEHRLLQDHNSWNLNDPISTHTLQKLGPNLHCRRHGWQSTCTFAFSFWFKFFMPSLKSRMIQDWSSAIEDPEDCDCRHLQECKLPFPTNLAHYQPRYSFHIALHPIAKGGETMETMWNVVQEGYMLIRQSISLNRQSLNYCILQPWSCYELQSKVPTNFGSVIGFWAMLVRSS